MITSFYPLIMRKRGRKTIKWDNGCWRHKLSARLWIDNCIIPFFLFKNKKCKFSKRMTISILWKTIVKSKWNLIKQNFFQPNDLKSNTQTILSGLYWKQIETTYFRIKNKNWEELVLLIHSLLLHSRNPLRTLSHFNQFSFSRLYSNERWNDLFVKKSKR